MCLCVRYVDIVINVTADIKVSKYLSSIYLVSSSTHLNSVYLENIQIQGLLFYVADMAAGKIEINNLKKYYVAGCEGRLRGAAQQVPTPS